MLPDGAGDRVALHREFGEITLAQMLNEWARFMISATFDRSRN
jgi:hypothetical protein